MTLPEKFLSILAAGDDTEMYAAIDKLTDNQKKIVIATFAKMAKEGKIDITEKFDSLADIPE